MEIRELLAKRAADGVRVLKPRRIDGLIMMPTGPDLSWLGVELASGLAVVTVDRTPAIPELDGVVVDNQGAAAEAVGHLMSYGHRRAPFGNRARLSVDSGTSWSEPMTISADAPGTDVGYPSTVELAGGDLLTVWYETLRDSPRAVLRQARWSLVR